MPDFFVDRIITLGSQEEFCKNLAEKVKFGGGSLRDVSTAERKGGNAVNIAYCLAKLGVKRTTLLTVADELGLAMLQKIFSKFNDRVHLIVEKGKHGHTTGLEFLSDKGTKANVMPLVCMSVNTNLYASFEFTEFPIIPDHPILDNSFSNLPSRVLIPSSSSYGYGESTMIMCGILNSFIRI